MIARVSASLIRLPMPYEPCPWANGRLGISHQRAILGDAGVLLVTDGMFVERAGGVDCHAVILKGERFSHSQFLSFICFSIKISFIFAWLSRW